MKILGITNLFPNHCQPLRGIFNKQQFVALSRLCALKVVAPVPWFPKGCHQDPRSIYAEVAKEENIDGISVYHPRYFVIPKIARSFYGYFFLWGVSPTIKFLSKKNSFDAILATWAYPDAFAAALIAKKMGKPLVIKVHGTDINVTTRYFWRRMMIKYALHRATKIIAVSRALKEKMIHLGIPEKKIEVVVNGVDPTIFKKMDPHECREKLSLPQDKKHVVFIGNLVEIKGVKHLIEAFKDLPEDIFLNVVGSGVLRNALEELVKKFGLEDRIIFRGKRPYEEIPLWYNAADIFCLPSLEEGCPNVVLEALACGTPVVASRVGAIPDVVDSLPKGILVTPADAPALKEAILQRLKLIQEDRGEFHHNHFDWAHNAQKVLRILEEVSR